MPLTPAALAPLRHSVFRTLWVATLASNTGLWIQNTGAGWLMTSLAPSPVMVSLVQAATMLPVFLFAVPGGALADILDRRLTLMRPRSGSPLPGCCSPCWPHWVCLGHGACSPYF